MLRKTPNPAMQGTAGRRSVFSLSTTSALHPQRPDFFSPEKANNVRL
jgi:hypothetical protein